MPSSTSSREVAWRLCATPRRSVAKRRAWVLDSGTKGTGAEMVPLDKVLKKPAPPGEPVFVPPKPRPLPVPEPEPRQRRRFKVVDVLSGRLLAEDVGARAAVRVLEGVRSVVDVRVYVWQPRAKKWRLLTMGEQKAMWDRRAT
jgi:hypothetical protein